MHSPGLGGGYSLLPHVVSLTFKNMRFSTIHDGNLMLMSHVADDRLKNIRFFILDVNTYYLYQQFAFTKQCSLQEPLTIEVTTEVSFYLWLLYWSLNTDKSGCVLHTYWNQKIQLSIARGKVVHIIFEQYLIIYLSVQWSQCWYSYCWLLACVTSWCRNLIPSSLCLIRGDIMTVGGWNRRH